MLEKIINELANDEYSYGILEMTNMCLDSNFFWK